MALRIIVNGAQGRMGQEAVRAIKANEELLLVGEGLRGTDLTALIHQTQANVVVDFTNAEVVYENTLAIIQAGVHPVIGTTGLQSKELQTLQEMCAEKKLGGIIAPNFSIGAALMMHFVKEAAHYFSHVEIIEMHHDGKLDAPSGTAIKTAALIQENRISQPTPLACKEIIPGSRGASEHGVPIHAVRLPGLVAHQQVIFGSIAETLTIKHDTINRACFMPGLLLACKQVISLSALVYGLEHLIKL